MTNLEQLNQFLFESLDEIKNSKDENRESVIEKSKATVEVAKTIILNSQLQLNIARALSGDGEVNGSMLSKQLLPEGVEYSGKCRIIDHKK